MRTAQLQQQFKQFQGSVIEKVALPLLFLFSTCLISQKWTSHWRAMKLPFMAKFIFSTVSHLEEPKPSNLCIDTGSSKSAHSARWPVVAQRSVNQFKKNSISAQHWTVGCAYIFNVACVTTIHSLRSGAISFLKLVHINICSI